MNKEIKEMEEAGIDVVQINSQGRLEYATKMNSGINFCDSCTHLIFLPDPDPDDWFRDDDKKAVCAEMKALIAGSLEFNELTNIRKPLWCPMLGRELAEEEKAKAKEMLDYARSIT